MTLITDKELADWELSPASDHVHPHFVFAIITRLREAERLLEIAQGCKCSAIGVDAYFAAVRKP